MRRTIAVALFLSVVGYLSSVSRAIAQDKAADAASIDGVWEVSLTFPAGGGGRDVEDVLLIAGGKLRSKVFLSLGYEAGKITAEKSASGGFRIRANLSDRRGGFVQYSGTLDPEGKGSLTILRHVPGRAAAHYHARVKSREPLGAPPEDVTKKTVEWVAKNNAWHPGHPIVADTKKNVAAQVELGQSFQWRLGAKLVKSGKATILASDGGELFVLELTPKQADALGLAGASAAFVRGSKVDAARGTTFELADMKLTGDKPGADGQLRGTIALKKKPERGVEARYALRLTFTDDSSTRKLYSHLGNWLLKDTITFSFSNPIKGEKPKVIVAFVDLGAFVNRTDFLPISRTTAVVIEVHPKGP